MLSRIKEDATAKGYPRVPIFSFTIQRYSEGLFSRNLSSALCEEDILGQKKRGELVRFEQVEGAQEAQATRINWHW